MVIPQLILGLSLKFQVTCRLGELPLHFPITLCTEQQKWWSALLLYCYSGMDAYVLSFHSVSPKCLSPPWKYFQNVCCKLSGVYGKKLTLVLPYYIHSGAKSETQRECVKM